MASETTLVNPQIHPWENLFPPVISDMMKCCLEDRELNRRGGNVRFKNCKTSAPNHVSDPLHDRMVVCIPYCGTHVNFEIIFDYRDPSLPPDIVLSDSDFNPDIQKLAVLGEWDAGDPSMLSSLLQQLLQQFTEHCSRTIGRYQRLQFELHTLEESKEYSKVEVFVLPKEDNSDEPEALFYIPLTSNQVGLSHLSEMYHTDEIALIVKLSPPNASQAKTTIVISPELDKALGNISKINLPSWGTDCSPCLMDYIPLVHQALKDKVKRLTKTNEIRKDFIIMWLSAYEGAVLEYDAEKYTFISFLFEIKGFSIVVHLALTVGFPIEPPIIRLRSVYHKLDGYPFELVSKNYEFSSLWPADEMMEKTKKHVLELIPKFKDLSVKKGELLT